MYLLRISMGLQGPLGFIKCLCTVGVAAGFRSQWVHCSLHCILRRHI
jgi:hypothetical protein